MLILGAKIHKIDVEARLPKNRLRDYKQLFRDCLVVK